MVTSQNNRVSIVGCGQLGSRHLQAVSCLPEVSEIEIIDPNPESLELGKKRLSDVANRVSSIKYKWLSSPDQMSADGDLCIVATQAKGRVEVVKEISAKKGYKK